MTSKFSEHPIYTHVIKLVISVRKNKKQIRKNLNQLEFYLKKVNNFDEEQTTFRPLIQGITSALCDGRYSDMINSNATATRQTATHSPEDVAFSIITSDFH